MGWGPFSYSDHDDFGRGPNKPIHGLFILVCQNCGMSRSEHKKSEIRSCFKNWKELQKKDSQ